MAFVFGSYAKGQEMSESDLDVAVYFRPQGRSLEWEEIREYEGEDLIWSDVERLMGLKTDLIILNRAAATLAYSVLQEGIPIVIKDHSLYLRFLLMISEAAQYFREFTREFWQIKQRSLSLSETDKDRLIRIADFLEMELKDQSQFTNLQQSNFEKDATLRRNVERWVENIVNASIDLAKILLAGEKKKIPETYRQIMESLSSLENFPIDLTQRLGEFTKLRNILAHEYLDIRFQQIQKFLHEGIPHYKILLVFIKNVLKAS